MPSHWKSQSVDLGRLLGLKAKVPIPNQPNLSNSVPTMVIFWSRSKIRKSRFKSIWTDFQSRIRRF